MFKRQPIGDRRLISLKRVLYMIVFLDKHRDLDHIMLDDGELPLHSEILLLLMGLTTTIYSEENVSVLGSSLLSRDGTGFEQEEEPLTGLENNETPYIKYWRTIPHKLLNYMHSLSK